MGNKKVKLRMGIHNRITIDRFQAIKDDLNNGLPVAKVAKRHSVSDSTVRKVKRSKNFREYRIDAESLRNRRQPIVVVAEKSGLAFEDFGAKPIFSSKMLKDRKTTEENEENRTNDKPAKRSDIMVLGVVAILVLGLIIILIVGGTQ